MKKIYLAVTLFLFYSVVTAQNQVSVIAGTDLYISSGTEFSSDGLSLTPSAGFSFNGVALSKGTTVSHSTSNTYVSRVYQFSSNTPAFTGTIRFYYDDAELNGLNELSLRVNGHNGTVWQSFSSNSNNTTSNYVQTNSITSTVLNELTLADAFSTLPLKWGLISAYRHGQSVKIIWNTLQENNVQHFEVERSTDGLHWNSVINGVTARNGGVSARYDETDVAYSSQRLYYRIKQVDMDGHFTYSMVALVNEEKQMNMLTIYPNPFVSSFNIGSIDPLKIKTVQLFNNNGSLVKTWNGPQSSYPVQTLASGTYTVKIIMTDDSSQQLSLQKQ
jgi:Secretion system C-terminal sorting domain